MREKLFFKYNSDDILEIISEYLAKKNGFKTFSTKSILLGNADSDDMRAIIVVGELEDEEIDQIDLRQTDKNMEYNGEHNKKGLTKQELKAALEKMISTGDF
jgi:hypothetical protein